MVLVSIRAHSIASIDQMQTLRTECVWSVAQIVRLNDSVELYVRCSKDYFDVPLVSN